MIDHSSKISPESKSALSSITSEAASTVLSPTFWSLKNFGCTIHTIRGVHVVLDSDVAKILKVPTKRLNQQVKRNDDHFPHGAVFKLTDVEFKCLRSQNVTAKIRGGRTSPPLAYTEEGFDLIQLFLRKFRGAMDR